MGIRTTVTLDCKYGGDELYVEKNGDDISFIHKLGDDTHSVHVSAPHARQFAHDILNKANEIEDEL